MMFRATSAAATAATRSSASTAGRRSAARIRQRRASSRQGRDGDRPHDVRGRRDAAVHRRASAITSAAVDNDGPMLGGGGLGAVKEDGTFELKGWRRAADRAASLPPGWTLKSVKLNGTDITDTGAEFKAGRDGRGLEIVADVEGRPTVSGAVTAAERRAVKDYTVVVFAEMPQSWAAADDAAGSRHAAGSGRPVPGARICRRAATTRSPSTTSPQGEWGDPELLDRLQGQGQALHARRRRDEDARSEARLDQDGSDSDSSARSDRTARAASSVVVVVGTGPCLPRVEVRDRRRSPRSARTRSTC